MITCMSFTVEWKVWSQATFSLLSILSIKTEEVGRMLRPRAKRAIKAIKYVLSWCYFVYNIVVHSENRYVIIT